ncbi:MAG: hypothetical protein ACR2FS_07775 [Phormidesmis sp.]
MPIALTHTGTSVTLTHFKATATLPRTKNSSARLSMAYSYQGNAYPTGPRRTPERWQFTALVDQTQWNMLRLIEDKSEQAARTAPYTGFEIELIDTTQLVTEAVRSRAASGSVVANADGSVTYAPVWQALFESLELEMEGRRLWAIATLVEGSRTSP